MRPALLHFANGQPAIAVQGPREEAAVRDLLKLVAVRTDRTTPYTARFLFQVSKSNLKKEKELGLEGTA
jgi:thioredoxin-like negative regulator of GroEL